MDNRLKRLGRQILDTLEMNGYEAYWVGGCVRDSVMGRPVKDMDIATSAAPEITAGLFARTIPTGLQHGTVTVLIEGQPFEVTTFRKESEYENHRRPAGVEFITSLAEDLKRRDFTINAMAMDRSDRLIDPLGGRADLAEKRIRAVGDPALRFREDALRMLRCVRFAADYGFTIEAATRQALLENAPLLEHVAMERVRAELERMIAGCDPYTALQLLASFGLLRHTKKPLALPLARWGPQDIPEQLTRIGELKQPSHRWMLLGRAMETDADHLARELGKLTFSKSAKTEICRVVCFARWLQDNLSRMQVAQSADVPARLRELWAEGAVRFGSDTLSDWLEVERVDKLPEESALRELLALLIVEGSGWLQAIPAVTIRELAVRAPDLLSVTGLPAGPWVGHLLQDLLLDAAKAVVPNRKRDLLDRAQVYLRRLNADE